ncbi:uncharacterized protein ColSpa_10939 [Colletotrichum spaethianum]|uniref:Stress-response A/B barrel domain-containing protein n=1 Tax=Colletotrichum spaethianum TaxID=700344 RepID=A0AA37PEK4_9PEZI|nr:uncharacterized protein ColSpa_10939 [Colletotrichum spaethianum]GKT50758.1 hypothetical protein ColSpa_10939 [Colletotrichum spaethianum]
MAGRIHRVTMFKIADEGQKQQLIEQYKVLGSSQKKVRPRGDRSLYTLALAWAGGGVRPEGFDARPRASVSRVPESPGPAPPSPSTTPRWIADAKHIAIDNPQNTTKADHRAPQDGKPYILSMVVGPAADDPRTQGFTVVAKTEFASLDDMKYYDDECAAHGALKAFVKEKLTVGGVMSVYFEPQIVNQL